MASGNSSVSTDPNDADIQRMLSEYFEDRHRHAVDPDILNSMDWDPPAQQVINDENTQASPTRVGTSEWCLCGNCMPMQSEEESLCCREIENIVDMLNEQQNCICNLPYLREQLSSREHVLSLYRYGLSYVKSARFRSPEQMQESDYRKTAYRSFTMWVYGYLGPKRRRPIPSCTVKLIRSHFPAPDAIYMGFRYADDDPIAVELV
ncbi:Hypothetical predicted protein [Pelobates cultripes]|uniref:P2X purinoreceptor 7 intracellular domain-containing protein n=1 Tax=Pelobates cultripes TaxID=61616 RepID=A0AAD1VXA3_PELCU|nr:Hypothetical predicted protein [Pelobates cultripes]CAH2293081.1 Hypothetical predicted protein [Pelobates cultripes]CAH2300121.1 Hypothetical predicted protein [Pelobates cultripes]CAH2320077.1 Hypothetical predicted protein [Pelobates cultripes]